MKTNKFFIITSCFFLTALLVALCLTPRTVKAEPKPWIWSWKNSHWKNLDFRPYIEPPKLPHNSQWNDSNWRPADWVAQREDGLALVEDFYFSNILTGQYVDDKIPVLEVGPAFYHLGGQDKRRVLQTVDEVYEITENDTYGMFMLYDWKSKKAIGVFTQHGLQLH